MNRQIPNAPTSRNHFAGLGRPAIILAAVAALNSCAAPANQSPLVTYGASDALPPVGQASPSASAEPGDGLATEPGANLMPLDPWERAKLAQGARQRSAEISNDETAAAHSPAQAPSRPPVFWNPIKPRVDAAPPAYNGPETSAPVEGPMGPPSPFPVMNAAEQQPDVEKFAEATPPVLKLADLITPLKSQLAMQAADSDSPLREHLVAASLLMLGDQRRTDPATLHDLTDREREVLAAYQDHYARIGEALRTGAGVDAVVKGAGEIASALTAEGRLRIAEFRLCSRIVNYGMYDEIASYKFPAMRPTPLLTYVEIEGFKSVPGGDGKFITRVRHELELYTERDGELVYAWPAAPAEDVCGKVRHDFFLPRQIELPSNLTMGRYRLKVRIIDEQSQNQAESVMAFAVVAGGDVAQK